MLASLLPALGKGIPAVLPTMGILRDYLPPWAHESPCQVLLDLVDTNRWIFLVWQSLCDCSSAAPEVPEHRESPVTHRESLVTPGTCHESTAVAARAGRVQLWIPVYPTTSGKAYQFGRKSPLSVCSSLFLRLSLVRNQNKAVALTASPLEMQQNPAVQWGHLAFWPKLNDFDLWSFLMLKHMSLQPCCISC